MKIYQKVFSRKTLGEFGSFVNQYKEIRNSSSDVAWTTWLKFQIWMTITIEEWIFEIWKFCSVDQMT